MTSLAARFLRIVLRFAIKRHLLQHRKTTPEIVAAMRRRFEMADARYFRVPADVQIERVDDGGVAGEWIACRSVRERRRVVLYVHGGGMVACRPLGYRAITVLLARASRAPVFAVDYRRAPEARFPAALDDVIRAYDALRQRFSADAVVLAGDSAGGNLSLTALLALRRRGVARPMAGLAVLSPWTDLENTGESYLRNAETDDLLIGPRDGVPLAHAYADAVQLRDPLVSPLYGDFRGGPPLLVFASTIEMLLDDAGRLVQRTRAQGVDTTYALERALPHAWPIFPMLPEARRDVARIAAFFERCWVGAATPRAALC